VSSTAIASRSRFRLGAVALAVTLGLGTAACSSSSKSGARVDPTTSAVAGTSVPPGYAGQVKVPDAAVNTIRTYEVKNGPPIGSWTITSVQVSAVDPTYVLYRISPTPGHANVQGGYGFAHQTGSTWTVVGFGTDAVGCPPGATGDKVIPATVLGGFRLGCPG
jgi:hypothetical protein